MEEQTFRCKQILTDADGVKGVKRKASSVGRFVKIIISIFSFLLPTTYYLLFVPFLFTPDCLSAGGIVYWTPDGIKLSDKRAYPSDMISDGKGGAIVVLDGTAINDSIYAQRVNGSGNLLWGSNGVFVGGSYLISNGAKAVPDGKGGVIVVWERYSSLTYLNLFIQRLDSTGTMLWNPNGLLICNADSDQCYPAVVTDGAGGAIIAWQDGRNGTSGNWDICAQRVDSAGNVRWTINGVPVCTASSEQIFPAIVQDDSCGAIIAWTDMRNGLSDIYAQRLNANGEIQWGTNGIAVVLEVNRQSMSSTVIDGSGGAVIVWNDQRIGQWDIYAQRINRTGYSMWQNNGIPICDFDSIQGGGKIIKDSAGSAIIAWGDYRRGNYDIYAQRIDSSGVKMWDSLGIPICIADSTQQYPAIVSDGDGGAIIAWEDKRNYTANRWDIYAQHVDSSGAVLWDTNGMVICTAQWSQGSSAITTDMAGGAIIAWGDNRDLAGKTYAQRVGDDQAGITEKMQDARYRIQDMGLEIYPNPITVRATIRYYLPVKSEVELFICDILGQRIMPLINEHQGSGYHTINLDKRLDRCQRLSGGVYFAVLKTDNNHIVEKFLFVK